MRLLLNLSEFLKFDDRNSLDLKHTGGLISINNNNTKRIVHKPFPKFLTIYRNLFLPKLFLDIWGILCKILSTVLHVILYSSITFQRYIQDSRKHLR